MDLSPCLSLLYFVNSGFLFLACIHTEASRDEEISMTNRTRKKS